MTRIPYEPEDLSRHLDPTNYVRIDLPDHYKGWDGARPRTEVVWSKGFEARPVLL